MNSIDETSTISSIRIAMYWILGMAACMVASLVAYIVIHAIKDTSVDWNGIGIFLGSISVFTGTGMGAKVWQKKFEGQKDNEQITAQ